MARACAGDVLLRAFQFSMSLKTTHYYSGMAMAMLLLPLHGIRTTTPLSQDCSVAPDCDPVQHCLAHASRC